jgi:VanW like protein
VFNAAFEAGLPITARTNHSLYISHYPTGRDATVNYPDLDLRFINDTRKWLLLRTFVGSSSLTVALYGTPVNRRIEVDTAPLRVTAEPTVRRIPDPARLIGEAGLESYGEPARTTSVRRRVYTPGGKLLHDTTWSSFYVAEPRIVHVGTKPKPKAKPKPPPPPTTTEEDKPTTTGEDEPAEPPTTTEEAPPPPPPAGRPN